MLNSRTKHLVPDDHISMKKMSKFDMEPWEHTIVINRQTTVIMRRKTRFREFDYHSIRHLYGNREVGLVQLSID